MIILTPAIYLYLKTRIQKKFLSQLLTTPSHLLHKKVEALCLKNMSYDQVEELRIPGSLKGALRLKGTTWRDDREANVRIVEVREDLRWAEWIEEWNHRAGGNLNLDEMEEGIQEQARALEQMQQPAIQVLEPVVMNNDHGREALDAEILREERLREEREIIRRRENEIRVQRDRAMYLASRRPEEVALGENEVEVVIVVPPPAYRRRDPMGVPPRYVDAVPPRYVEAVSSRRSRSRNERRGTGGSGQ